MQEIIFDFDRIGTEADFYKTAITKLELPEYFGNNLDALYDVLTGAIALPVLIRFTDLSLGQLEKFSDIIAVFEDAAAELEEQLIFEYYLKKP
ncbi:barstar family protein [Niabella drilacis]|uniref:Ribonuclease inhibitor n=1 Tax=Niabella drilacis (strain DSM 25811 / CCM 8410 / CCUG 62505 / LMG 26954 / E90) TaxID=1285928 RepID=A0A1G6SLM0_NIADE|nr:barstar family protein [Niabella drilacis]SDD17810.1 ribonuclease inhibitor [Niabella drilacis]